MIDEISWSIETKIVVCVILAVVTWWLIRHMGCFSVDIERLEEGEHNDTPKLTNEHYGAVIQSQGRYYN